MKLGIAVAVLVLLVALVGSALTRRAEWRMNGESGAMLLGLVLCVMAVVFILVAVA